MKDTIKYEENQSMWWLILLLIVIGLLPLFFIVSKEDVSKAVVPLSIIAIVFSTIGVLFYQLFIKITTTHITIGFGIGFPKRTVAITDLDIAAAEVIDVTLLTGIGYRITNKGILYNSRVGKCLYIPSLSGDKAIYVSTDHSERILKLLSELKK